MTFVEQFRSTLLPRPVGTPVVTRPSKPIGEMTVDELFEHDEWICKELVEIACHPSADDYRMDLLAQRRKIWMHLWGRIPRDGEGPIGTVMTESMAPGYIPRPG